MKHTEKTPLETLRHHVTGAIERGEAQAIAGIPAKPAKPAKPVKPRVSASVRILGLDL